MIYCYDTTNEEASDRFLKSQELCNKVADEFMLCARRIYESDAPNKDYFFTDWSDAEMEKLMHYTTRVSELEQRNAELLVAYRDMEDPTTDPRIAPIYREFVQNNNEIASIYGYDNFDINTAAVPLYPVRTALAKSDEERIKDILKQEEKIQVKEEMENDQQKIMEKDIDKKVQDKKRKEN